ncbi:MAG: 3'(2'),5'-bisphosphate nucleotidase CysQ [Acidobacteriia bacterium]|nr:3'(2'),5'-bisphosphate nucleotidase CysQ [Terriglobia bacterium]
MALAAGQILAGQYAGENAVEWKANAEPVTLADRLANDFLVCELAKRFPDDGILSEEAPDRHEPCRNRRVWIIDPMDGTAEFIAHRDEFAVMIGLAVDGVPTLGVIYQPIGQKLYYAAAGEGAFLKTRGMCTALHVSAESDPQMMTVALSRSHHCADVDRICRRVGITKTLWSGSIGLKVGLICEGRAHVYLHTAKRVSQWDTCAPEAVLREAGGRMTDLYGMPLPYAGSELRHLNGVIASNGAIHARIVEAASYG